MTITITPESVLPLILAIAAGVAVGKGTSYGIDQLLDWWDDWREERQQLRDAPTGQPIEDATRDPEAADEPYTPTPPPGIPFAITDDTLHTTYCEHATDVLGLLYCPTVEDARAKAETLQLEMCEHCDQSASSTSSDSEYAKELTA